MTLYELSDKAVSRLITSAPKVFRYLLFRAGTQRWTPPDLHDLLEQLLPLASLSIWKFTRVLTKRDGALGKAAERLGKHEDAVGGPFDKWPQLRHHSRYQSKYLAGDRSFAYGFTELTVTEAIEAGADLVSFINYPSGFDASGLLALQPVGSPALSKRSVESTLEFLQLLMTSQSQKYSSQEEWDQDLKPKEEALIKAVGNLVNDRMIPVIPLINANVEVSLLGICWDECIDSLSRRNLRIRPLADNNTREWEVGLFR